MKKTIGRILLLLVALVLILAALGQSIGVIELSIMGILLLAGIFLIVADYRRTRRQSETRDSVTREAKY